MLGLTGAGGAAWWFYRPAPPVTEERQAERPPEPVPTPTPPPVAPPDPPAPNPPAPEPRRADGPIPPACDGPAGPAAASTPRDIVRRPGCGTDAYAAIADGMRGAGRHDDALLLLEVAVERGSGAAMLALARLYDPGTFVRGQPFDAPDARQAARYYADAERAGAEAAADRTRLRAALETRAASGDEAARITLGDFWP